MNESLLLSTRTLKGRDLLLRDLKLADFRGLLDCIGEPSFSYPLLTGTPDPVGQPVRPLRRALQYALACNVGNKFGPLLFGSRRHWIIAILDARDQCFLGVAMVDEVLREYPVTRKGGFGDRFLKHSERRLHLRIGDGELGFFLHPKAQGEGIALQAIYALLDKLSYQSETGDASIIRRVWAETGADNFSAQNLLRKIGLVERPELEIAPALSRRYKRDGTPIALVHFDQPLADEHAVLRAPVRARLAQMVESEIANPNWSDIAT